jgi:hemin uptake protein HemP
MTLQTQSDFSRPAPQPVAAQRIPLHRAQDLTRGGQLAQIDLDGQVYALRITRAGKLILTK